MEQELNGYIVRKPDRVQANIKPIQKSEEAYNKALKVLTKSIEAVKTVINEETKRYEADVAKVEATISETEKQYQDAKNEMDEIILKESINSNEAGIAAGGRVAFLERKLSLLRTNKDSIPKFSDKGKAELRIALIASNEAESNYLKARLDYTYSIDSQLLDEGFKRLADTNVNYESINTIVNRPEVKAAFVTDPELEKLINNMSSDLVNLIVGSK